MKILVISDVHLDNAFEKPKYRFLKKIIRRADRVIINGDFWDGYLVKFQQFIQSPWKSLFPLLKSKKTIYIYGNHDKKILSDKHTALFSDIQTRLKFQKICL
jgi:predicted phosphodiesterase